jgi:hypothetical protein
MLIALWIVNALLALAFLGAGLMKVARPVAALQAAGMTWIEDFGPASAKVIGALEVIGAGLVLGVVSIVSAVLGFLVVLG